MKIRILKVIKNQKFKLKYISHLIRRLPYIDFFLHSYKQLLIYYGRQLEKREGQKIFGAAFSHFELISKVSNWSTHHTCKQNVTICLSLPFDYLLSWDSCFRFDSQ